MSEPPDGGVIIIPIGKRSEATYKFGAVVAVELPNREGSVVFDVRQRLERPGLGVIEEGTEFNPAESGVCGSQGMHILARCGLSAMVSD
jgi:hypothetical protein